MNKLVFYSRLAMQNLQKNHTFYLPYFLTCAGCAAMFYIMRFLNHSDLLLTIPGSPYVQSILFLGSLVVGYTILCILWYANRFVMKRRERELGLYNILGMEKIQVGCVLTLETVYLGLASIALGLAAGVLFSKLVLMGLLRLVRFEVPMGFTVSKRGLAETAVIMAACFAFMLVRNLITIHRSRPVELLHSTNVGEREPKSRRLLAVFSSLCLAGGYAIAVFVPDPISALLLFFVAVMLVVVGTNGLFTAVSVVLLKALRKNKAFYYKPRNFTAVSGMLYRMKQNAKGLSNICILATMVLVVVSTTVCMYCGVDNALRTLYPNEIWFSAALDPATVETAELAPARSAVLEAAAPYGVTENDLTAYLHLAFTAVEDTDGYAMTSYNYHTLSEDVVLDFITAEDYARMTNSTVTLSPEELLVCGDVPAADTVHFGAATFQIAGMLPSFPVRNATFASEMTRICYFVVADRSVLLSLYNAQLAAYGEAQASDLGYSLALNPKLSADDAIACHKAVSDVLNAPGEAEALGLSWKYLSSECRQANEDGFYSMYGGFVFLGLFLGLLFLLATVLIIYYKQLSEGYEDRERFVILQKVGMSADEVRATIRKQVLMVFFLPLLVAAVHICFAFPMLARLLSLFSLSNIPLFLLCTAITFCIFTAGYVFVYLLTAKKYYQIVRA